MIRPAGPGDTAVSAEIAGAFVALIALLWGVLVTTLGWRTSFRLRRADFIRAYTNDFYASESMKALFLDIEHGRFGFSREDDGTARELELAELLDYFNTIGMSLQQGLLKRKDLRRTTIGYAALVTWRDPCVVAFLQRTDASDAAKRAGVRAFWYFRQMGERLDDSKPRWYLERDTLVRRSAP